MLRACLQINALETRSAGLAVASCMNLLFSFVISQCFLNMLCTLQVGQLRLRRPWYCSLHRVSAVSIASRSLASPGRAAEGKA